MSQIIIPYTIGGMLLALLVGGVAILGHAVKTWIDEKKNGVRHP